MEGRARGRLIEGERNSIQSRNSIPPIQRNSIPPIQPNFYSKPAHTLLSFPQGPIPNKAQRLTRKFRASAFSVLQLPGNAILFQDFLDLTKRPQFWFSQMCECVISHKIQNAGYKIQNLHNLQHSSIQRDFVISWSP